MAPGYGYSLLADIVAHVVNVETHPLWALVNQQAMSSVDARERQVSDHRAILASGDPTRSEGTMRKHLVTLTAAIYHPAFQAAAPATV